MAAIDNPHAGKVLVTGATGFVGRALCTKLAALGYTVRLASRVLTEPTGDNTFETVTVGEFGPHMNWSAAVSGISTVFHLAARTHVLQERSPDTLAEYRRVNVEGTRGLALASRQAGVRRIVFLSSIKVHGERTGPQPFSETSAARPEDAYGLSKWEAEQTLCAIARDTGLETVVLRPPLVYGPGAKGNFLRLMHWVSRGMPLPLASIDNRRSLIYIGNLVDAIITAGTAARAAGETFLVCDDEDISTPGLIRALATALGVRPRLFPCPPLLLVAAAASLGKHEAIKRLTDSLQVDSARFRGMLQWHSHIALAQGLAHTAQWYHSRVLATLNN